MLSTPVIPNRISVVMPCYNAAPYLAEAVGSALGQSYPDVEVVLVDDGSVDDSARSPSAWRRRIRID